MAKDSDKPELRRGDVYLNLLWGDVWVAEESYNDDTDSYDYVLRIIDDDYEEEADVLDFSGFMYIGKIYDIISVYMENKKDSD